MSLKQPIGQKRLTNVALVKYKKKGKRFEIACYKNKVLNWRNGVEKELDDVLQTTTVFANVSKGVLASHEDLMDVFGTQDEEKICIIILNEGDYQVSDKERELELDSLFKDVATILAEKCLNPHTRRPYTVSMLERALRDVHFSVDLKRNAKQQALEVLPRLKEKIAIERARMRLRMAIPNDLPNDAPKKLRELLASKQAKIESEDSGGSQVTLVGLVDPGWFRDIHNFVQQVSEGKGQVDVLTLGVMEQGDAHSQFDAWGPTQPTRLSSQNQGANGSEERGLNAASPSVPKDSMSQQRHKIEGTTTRPAATKLIPAEDVLYSRGPISGLPEEFESRRERFTELDTLQPGWELELRKRRAGSAVEAIFFSPSGEQVGSYVLARKQALRSCGSRRDDG